MLIFSFTRSAKTPKWTRWLNNTCYDKISCTLVKLFVSYSLTTVKKKKKNQIFYNYAKSNICKYETPKHQRQKQNSFRIMASHPKFYKLMFIFSSQSLASHFIFNCIKGWENSCKSCLPGELFSPINIKSPVDRNWAHWLDEGWMKELWMQTTASLGWYNVSASLG